MCFECIFISGRNASGCHIEYNSNDNDSTLRGYLTIGNTKDCKSVHNGTDNDNTDDNDDDTKTKLISMPYNIKAFEIDDEIMSEVAYIATANITTTASYTLGNSTEPSTSSTASIVTDNTTDSLSEGMGKSKVFSLY